MCKRKQKTEYQRMSSMMAKLNNELAMQEKVKRTNLAKKRKEADEENGCV